MTIPTPTTDLSAHDRRDLTRYRAAIADLLAGMTFSLDEAVALAQATAQLDFTEDLVRDFPALVGRLLRTSGLDQIWGVDAADFAGLLRTLTLADTYAVVDALERLPERLVAVGLLHPDAGPLHTEGAPT